MNQVVSAMFVLFGDYIEASKVQLPTEDNPEKALLEKEAFITLSDEAKELIALTANAPERIYQANGVLNPNKFRSYLKRRKGWSRKQAEELKFELWFFLKTMSLR